MVRQYQVHLRESYVKGSDDDEEALAPYECNTDRWHKGTYLQSLPRRSAPNGRDWFWDECATACDQRDDCEFWTLRMDRGRECLLLKNQGDYVLQRDHPHMEGTKDGSCLTEVCTATFWGDPHIVTFDGLKYDAMYKGEAILLKQEGSKLQVQGLFEKAFDNRGSNWNPAVTTAIAVHGSEVDQPIIEVSMSQEGDEEINGCPVELFVDGVKQEKIYHDSANEGGALVLFDEATKLISVEFPGVILLEIAIDRFGKCHFSTDVTLMNCETAENSVTGLLGSPNGNAADDWMDPDGRIKPIPYDGKGVYFGPAFEHTKEWIIDEDEKHLSLFDTYHPHDDEEYSEEYEEFVMNDDPEIDEVCGTDIACRVDGKSFGKDAAEEYKSNPAADRPPAVITPPVGETGSGNIESRSVDLDSGTFDADNEDESDDESLCDDEFLLYL